MRSLLYPRLIKSHSTKRGDFITPTSVILQTAEWDKTAPTGSTRLGHTRDMSLHIPLLSITEQRIRTLPVPEQRPLSVLGVISRLFDNRQRRMSRWFLLDCLLCKSSMVKMSADTGANEGSFHKPHTSSSAYECSLVDVRENYRGPLLSTGA